MNSQLPRAGEIFLDHVGHFVPDVEAARAALARAGFAPTPVSIQTQPDQAGAPKLTGTGNTTAMLSRGYLEVLFKTADTPLGLELDAALARYPGVHLVAFAVADAAAAHERLAQTGFRMRPLVHMQRKVDVGASQAAGSSPPPCGEGMGVGVVDDGTSAPYPATPLPNPPPQGGREGTAVAGFTVTRLAPGEMPEGRIQLLTHHTEQLVWQPRWLAHPNGALGLARVLMVIAEPEEGTERFTRLTGCAAGATASGQRITLDRGVVDLVTPAAFAREYPDVPFPSPPFIGLYEIGVASLERAEHCLVGGGLQPQRTDAGLLCAFPPELGQGAWLFSGPDY